jgi:hypothetical protein
VANIFKFIGSERVQSVLTGPILSGLSNPDRSVPHADRCLSFSSVSPENAGKVLFHWAMAAIHDFFYIVAYRAVAEW